MIIRDMGMYWGHLIGGIGLHKSWSIEMQIEMKRREET